MRNRAGKQRKLNNEGFTLVELLLCIAIISIVFMAIMNGFAISARVNLKAHKLQEATAFAQHVLEECRNAEDVEMVLLGYGGSLEEPNMDGSAYDALTAEQKKLCTEAMFTVSQYMMRNVMIDGGGKYDVEVITNPLPYSQFVTDKTVNPKVEDSNTFGTPNVNQIDNANNPIIKDEISRYDGAAVEELQALLPNGVKDGSQAQKDALKGDMHKEVTVTITDSAADTLTVSAEVLYRSAYDGHAVEKRYIVYQAVYPLEAQMKEVLDPISHARVEVFDKYVKGGNIFIFTSAMNGIKRNTITIENKSMAAEPLTVSLIRGGNVGESNYNQVILKNAAALSVYADTADAGVNPGGIAAVYNMNFYSNIKGVQADSIRQTDIDATLHDKAAAYRCFDITVNVYDPETGELAASLTSAQERK